MGATQATTQANTQANASQVLGCMRQADRLLITAHARPDGDAVGSVLALWMLLGQMGKHAEMAFSDRVPLLYRSLPCASQIRQWSRVQGEYDAVILLECDGTERTRMEGLENRFLINIDHHATGRFFAQVNWIDRGACAVAEMIYRLAKAANAPITRAMATCLYTAVLTDTGSFCYSGTDVHTFELAADLVRLGASPPLAAQNVYFSNPASKMRLLAAALSNLRLDGRLCWLWITDEDMKRCGAVEEDCEGIVNYAISICGVDIAAFLRELPDGRVRLSLRSKGHFNVAAIAERWGGGGHENASGCTLEGPLAAATERVLKPLGSGILTASCGFNSAL
jgi:bifunctional oligoribonuclease and PAP phosphatase NrnA